MLGTTIFRCYVSFREGRFLLGVASNIPNTQTNREIGSWFNVSFHKGTCKNNMKKLPTLKGGKHQSLQPINWNWKGVPSSYQSILIYVVLQNLPIFKRMSAKSGSFPPIWRLKLKKKKQLSKVWNGEMIQKDNKTNLPWWIISPIVQTFLRKPGSHQVKIGQSQTVSSHILWFQTFHLVCGKYCWWFRNPQKKTVEVGILVSHYFTGIFDTSKPVGWVHDFWSNNVVWPLVPQNTWASKPHHLDSCKASILERIVFNRKNWDIQQNMPIENLFCSINVHGQCIQPPCSIVICYEYV